MRSSNFDAQFCSSCGKMTDVEFNLSHVKLGDSQNPYERFFDLIPVKDSSLLPHDISYTDCVYAKELGKRIECDYLFLKNETQNPTGTTKFRMASVSLPYLFENNVKHFCTSSTGNSSTAYAQLISKIPELKMSLFTASEFQYRVNYEDTPQVEHYILEGATFVESSMYSIEFANKNGHTPERGFFNPGRREGLKLAFFEACDQVQNIIHKPIEYYVQSVSSAMGVFGTYKGAKELQSLELIPQLPRLLCVQQESCSPLVHAWQENAPKIEERHILHNPSGIAKALLRGNPSRSYPYTRKIVLESEGHFTAVSDEEIRNAKRWVLNDEGIDICFSAATAVAGLIQSVGKGIVAKDAIILINLTGADRQMEPLPKNIKLMRKAKKEWKEFPCQDLPK